MKILKILFLGVLIAVFIETSATSIFAQDDCDANYEQFKKLYKSPSIEDRNQAVKLAQKYLAEDKCKTDENRDIITFLKSQLKKSTIPIGDHDLPLYEHFNASVKSENWDETFASGKEIINKYPDTALDVALILASIGLDNARAQPPVDKYNTDTINWARWAIDHINNKSYNADKYGAFIKYEYKTKSYPDGKSNAIGWMNYIIGYITYERLKNQKEALSYLHKATQVNSATANIPGIYKEIGEWYLGEFNRVDNLPENASNNQVLAILALQKGYADRALDAYIRAYNVAPNTTQTEKIYKTALYNRAKIIYGARYDQKMDNFEKDITTMPSKPFPDPMSAVEPIVED